MTAPPLPDLAALKAELQSSRNIWAPGDLSDMCGRALAAIEALESRLAVPVGEALVEAACKAFDPMLFGEDSGIPSASDERYEARRRTIRRRIRAVLAVVVPQVREEAAKIADRIADEWPDAPEGRHGDWRHGRQDGAMEVAAAIREVGGE